MLSCAGADRLQTGMRGAYGKPQGLVARVRIGQPLMSMRVKEQHSAHAFEALRRAKFKFPGRQKIFTSKKWGLTKFDKEEFAEGNSHFSSDVFFCDSTRTFLFIFSLSF